MLSIWWQVRLGRVGEGCGESGDGRRDSQRSEGTVEVRDQRWIHAGRWKQRARRGIAAIGR